MENREETILSEIKETVGALKEQLSGLEKQMETLEALLRRPEPAEDEPSDFTQPVIVSEPEEALPLPEPVVEDLPANAAVEDLPAPEPAVVEFPAPEPEAPEVRTTIGESQEAAKAVIDVMSAKQAWRTDRPGSEVHDIRSAITLNDRVLFINSLFAQDPMAFQQTLTELNAKETLDEAVTYLAATFPEWDLESEVVYRFMMAVRRKIRK